MTDELPPARAYDLWSRTYDTDPNPMVALTRALVDELTPVPERVIEVGCGTGRNLEALAARGATHLAGVDLSAGMLERARARLPGADLHLQDARAPLPFGDASADLVLVTLVLEHIADPSPIFEEAARVLAARGRLVVIELHPIAYEVGSRARFTGDDGETFYTASHTHTGDEMNGYAERAGLEAGSLEDVLPSDEIARRYPSSRRLPGTPWLLQGTWRASPSR